MGRTPKNKAVEDIKEVETLDTTVDEVEVEKSKITPAKVTPITITATYKTKTVDGEVIKHRFSGTGANEAEALNNVKGSDEELVDEYGAGFPKKVNLLVNVTVKRGDYQFDRALAAQKAEAIFTGKNIAILKQLFGL